MERPLYVVRFDPVIESEQMSEGEEEESDAKSTFAHFGLAYYVANVLEHGLVNVLAMARLITARDAAEQLLSDPWEQRFKDTMGQLVRRAAPHLAASDGLEARLTAAMQTRNYLTHQFWRDRAEDFNFKSGRVDMIRELEAAQGQFTAADAELTEKVFKPMVAAEGITQDTIDAQHQMMRRDAEKRRNEQAD
jgi:hypothetical protein